MADSNDETTTSLAGKDAEAEAIIRKQMGLAMLGGLIPIPLVDLTAVTAVQLDMLKQLARVYRVELDAKSARAFVTSLTSALAGNMLARIGASLVKTIPGVGSVGGGIAQVALTGAATYSVGRLFKRLFREDRPLDDLDLGAAKDEVASYFGNGKRAAEELWRALRGGDEKGGRGE